MRPKTRIILCSVSIFWLPLTSVADIQVNPFVTAGITDGGDQIGSYTTSWWGGPTEVEVPVGAGETSFLFGGISLLWPGNEPATTRPGVGLMLQGGIMDGSTGYADNFDLSRNALEVLGTAEWNSIRFGVGVSQHQSLVLKDLTGVTPRTKFSNATGTVLQVDFLVGEHLTLGLRYVDIEYESASRRVDASNFGISAGWRFGRTD